MRKGIIEIKEIRDQGNGNVTCVLEIERNPENIVMSFSSNVHGYITTDRCDAMVMGLLMFAIRHRYDIRSQLPVSETLYYKLTHHFIPGICVEETYQPNILAPVVPDIKSGGEIVATGISCGVDSLYTVMEHIDEVPDSFRLNHLVFLDAGAHHFGAKDRWSVLYEGRKKNAIEFCKFVCLPLISITTNLPEVLEKYSEYDHVEHHTFMMLSCLLMIQGGLKKYYYSGGYPYGQFDCNLLSDRVLDCAHYDLFTLWAVSNGVFEFYSTGGSLTRFDKVKALRAYRPGEKFLNVCVDSVDNCGRCFKCKRTLLELDAAGLIERYGAVFDVEAYKAERRHRIAEGYRGAIKGDALLAEMMPFFKTELSPTTRLMNRVRMFCGRIVSLFR